jgi:hypothetical protein
MWLYIIIFWTCGSIALSRFITAFAGVSHNLALDAEAIVKVSVWFEYPAPTARCEHRTIGCRITACIAIHLSITFDSCTKHLGYIRQVLLQDETMAT